MLSNYLGSLHLKSATDRGWSWLHHVHNEILHGEALAELVSLHGDELGLLVTCHEDWVTITPNQATGYTISKHPEAWRRVASELTERLECVAVAISGFADWAKGAALVEKFNDGDLVATVRLPFDDYDAYKAAVLKWAATYHSAWRDDLIRTNPIVLLSPIDAIAEEDERRWVLGNTVGSLLHQVFGLQPGDTDGPWEDEGGTGPVGVPYSWMRKGLVGRVTLGPPPVSATAKPTQWKDTSDAPTPRALNKRVWRPMRERPDRYEVTLHHPDGDASTYRVVTWLTRTKAVAIATAEHLRRRPEMPVYDVETRSVGRLMIAGMNELVLDDDDLTDPEEW